MKGTRQTWADMRNRCRNPNAQQYKNYGARGIKICERWNVFANFLEDMGQRPEGLTLERINNDGDYCPENCRWATRAEQRANQRTCHMVTVDGDTITLRHAELRFGIREQTLFNRISRLGWSVAMATQTPVDKHHSAMGVEGNRKRWSAIAATKGGGT